MKLLQSFPHSHVLVLGLAKSGAAAAQLLLDSGIQVRINDMNAKETDENVVKLSHQGAEVIVGSHPTSVLDQIDLIVKNPGIPYEHPIIELAVQQGIRIITEVELAYELASGHDVIGITGSNGKTTTTMLVYEMLKESNQLVQLAGNIGIVATEVAQALKADEQLLLELSSFQLLGTEKFRPRIACLLNLYDAHLDYHGTVDAYEEAKSYVFSNQTVDDYLVYNQDDQKVVHLIESAKAKRVPFSTKVRLESTGAWTDATSLYFKKEPIIDINEVALVGAHNIENMLAAISIAKLNDASNESIRSVLRRFSGVEHRLQYITEVEGRSFYNDSKATNILATQKALQSFTSPVILLAGGLDREEDFTLLLPYLQHIKAMITFGETKTKLATVAKQANITHIHTVTDVHEATKLAYELSVEGDTILLSPACASWDQYKTFEERGNMFIETVHTLK